MKLKRYAVLTPSYEVYSASESDPPEYGRDYLEVEAENKRDARVLAVKIWRDTGGLKLYGSHRLYIEWYSDECPFANLEVTELVNT
jgi:hypothetical protein